VDSDAADGYGPPMGESLKIVVVDEGNQYIVKIGGEIDVGNCDQVSDVVKRLLARPKTIVIDLTGVSFMDSAGVGVLLKAHRWLADHAATLVLREPAGQVRRLFVEVGLESMLSD
jgi:anti-sigma B factor antagonist